MINFRVDFSKNSYFFVTVVGQIESGQFVDFGHVYVKYCFTYGNDWQVVDGEEQAITQVSKQSADDRQMFVWNFPVDITFKSR